MRFLLNRKVNKSQIIFFDLADFSKRSREDICEAVELINKFSNYYKVILGLNENEAVLMYRYAEISKVINKENGYDIVSTNYLYEDGKVVIALDDWTLN